MFEGNDVIRIESKDVIKLLMGGWLCDIMKSWIYRIVKHHLIKFEFIIYLNCKKLATKYTSIQNKAWTNLCVSILYQCSNSLLKTYNSCTSNLWHPRKVGTNGTENIKTSKNFFHLGGCIRKKHLYSIQACISDSTIFFGWNISSANLCRPHYTDKCIDIRILLLAGVRQSTPRSSKEAATTTGFSSCKVTCHYWLYLPIKKPKISL